MCQWRERRTWYFSRTIGSKRGLMMLAPSWSGTVCLQLICVNDTILSNWPDIFAFSVLKSGAKKAMEALHGGYGTLTDWFFSESFWLPPGIKWKDFENRDDGIYVAQPRDLLYSIPMAVVLFCVRQLFERYMFKFNSSWFWCSWASIQLWDN